MVAIQKHTFFISFFTFFNFDWIFCFLNPLHPTSIPTTFCILFTKHPYFDPRKHTQFLHSFMHNTQNKSILTLEDHHLNHKFRLPFTLSSKKTLINFKFILDKFFLLCYTKFIVKSAYYSTYVIVGHHTPFVLHLQKQLQNISKNSWHPFQNVV